MTFNDLLDLASKDKRRKERIKTARKFVIGVGVVSAVGVATGILFAVKTVEIIKDAVQNKTEAVKDAVQNKTEAIKDAVQNKTQSVKDVKKDIKDGYQEIKKDIHKTAKNVSDDLNKVAE
jgi:gas vesicle protein